MKVSDQVKAVFEDQDRNSQGMLLGLNRLGHIYAGTVPHAVKKDRRRKNKLARAARRINR